MSVGNRLNTVCRVCKSSHLTELFLLGEQFVSDFVSQPYDICTVCNGNGQYAVNSGGPDGEEYVDCDNCNKKGMIPVGIKCEIALQLCNNCTLIQQKWTAPQDFMYTRHYWYRSGVTQTMRDALRDIAKECWKRTNAYSGDIVLDIGANDGTLLSNFSGNGILGFRRVAVEPATNLHNECLENCDVLLNGFWDADKYLEVMNNKKAKIITAIGMFYDLDSPNEFIADVKKVLHPDGIFVCQLMCAKQMLENMDVGNLSHEHLEFYTLASLQCLFEQNGLEIEDIEENKVNGGSYRLYVRHTGKVDYSTHHRKKQFVTAEIQSHVYMASEWRDWYKKLETYKSKLRAFIAGEVDDGKTVYVYGASTKGNVILQWLGCNNEDIPYAADKSEEKWGKYTVGSGIKIISEDEMRKAKPDYLFVLPYAFLPEFIDREMELLKQGTKLIVPLPVPQIVSAGNKHILREPL